MPQGTTVWYNRQGSLKIYKITTNADYMIAPTALFSPSWAHDASGKSNEFNCSRCWNTDIQVRSWDSGSLPSAILIIKGDTWSNVLQEQPH